jgi:hypothetical protein
VKPSFGKLSSLLAIAGSILFGALVCVGEAPAENTSPRVGDVPVTDRDGWDGAGGRALLLGKGRVRSLRWEIYAHRKVSSRGVRRLCLRELLFWDNGLASEGTSCAGSLLPEMGGWPIYTLAHLGKGRRGIHGDRSVFGTMLPPDVVRVTLHLDSGRSEDRRTRLVSEARAARVGLPQFRYVTFGGVDMCLSGISGHDAGGNVIVDTVRYPCGPSIEGPGGTG